MFVNHAIAVGSNGPSPPSVPFVPFRNVSPHTTIVVIRFGAAAPTAAFGFVAAVAAVVAVPAVPAVAAVDEADAAAGDEADAAGRCCNAAGDEADAVAGDEADAAVRCCRTAAICERRPGPSASGKAIVASTASRGMEPAGRGGTSGREAPKLPPPQRPEEASADSRWLLVRPSGPSAFRSAP